MGFLKNLFTNTADRLADDLIDNVKNKALSSMSASKSSLTNKKLSVNERIEKVIHEYYPDYEFDKNISADIFNAASNTCKYSYVLKKNGSICLTIIVLSDKNAYRKSNVVAAHNASENAGVHCINIMTYLPSEEEYINQRIAENIR